MTSQKNFNLCSAIKKLKTKINSDKNIFDGVKKTRKNEPPKLKDTAFCVPGIKKGPPHISGTALKSIAYFGYCFTKRTGTVVSWSL